MGDFEDAFYADSKNSFLEYSIRNANHQIQNYDYFTQALEREFFEIKLNHVKLKNKIQSETVLSLFDETNSDVLIALETYYPNLSKKYNLNKERFEKIKKEGVLKHSEVSKDLLLSLQDLICVRDFSPQIRTYFKTLQIYFDSEFKDSNLKQILLTFYRGSILDLSPEAISLAEEFNNGPSFCNPSHADYELSAGKRKGYYLNKIKSMLNFIESKVD